MNPAVSLAMWTLGKIPFTHVLIYSVVQTVAAFIGAGLSFLLYYGKYTTLPATPQSCHF